MGRLRGALFGCGMISEFHLRGWNRIPEVEIVALGNRTISKAEQRRDQFVPGARVYSELATLLEREQLDFIDILTAPEVHRQQCLLAKRAGLHIICQKPLCDKLEDARELVREMADYPRLFAVHENHRYRPWYQQVLERRRAGFFGEIRLASFQELRSSAPAEAYKRASPTGVLLEYGSHLVDMMRALLGEPRRVYARLHHVNPEVRGETLAHCVYEYPNATAVVEVGWKGAGMEQANVVISGCEGEAWFEGSLVRGQEGRLRLARGREIVHDQRTSTYDDYVESFYLLERECVDAMLGRREGVVQTGMEHLRTLACTFAAYQSAERGAVIEIPEQVL